MSLLPRRQRNVVPAEVTQRLSSYGQAVLSARRAGTAVSDSGFGWANFVDLVRQAIDGPDRQRALQELFTAATTATDRDLATLGAYQVLMEATGGLDDDQFLQLCDASLEYMRSLGLSSGHLTGYEAARWIQLHGELRASFDSIVEVAVPEADQMTAAKPLGLGESRMIALTGPLPQGNAFYAEHRADGSYAVFSERPGSVDNPTRVRCEESYLGAFSELTALYRAVGNMFGSLPYWADEELEPYFPARRT